MAGLTYVAVDGGYDVVGSKKVSWVDVTFDSSYPTGGETFSLAKFSITNALEVAVVEYDSDAAPYVVRYNRATNKLQVYYSAGFTPAGTVAAPTFTGSALGNHTHNLLLKNAAVADGATTRVNAGTNLLGANIGSDITVTGAGANGGVVNASGGTPAGTNSAPAFTGTAVAAAGLVEVANAVDLSALTVRIRAIGT